MAKAPHAEIAVGYSRVVAQRRSILGRIRDLCGWSVLSFRIARDSLRVLLVGVAAMFKWLLDKQSNFSNSP